MATQTDRPGWRDEGEDLGDGNDSKAKAQEVAGQAQEKAQVAAGQVQDRLREQLDQRSSQVAGRINQQASDLRSVSEALRGEGKEGPAKAADRLASYGERVGGYLRDRDADALLRDAEEFGRRKPAAVITGGLVLGFAAGRFLKASSGRRYSSQSTGRSSLPGSGAVPNRRPGDSADGMRGDGRGGVLQVTPGI
ncbi:MAG TPA: hypothetical protein VIX82_07945 [Solirubrobacteraceae bacterium]